MTRIDLHNAYERAPLIPHLPDTFWQILFGGFALVFLILLFALLFAFPDPDASDRRRWRP